MSTQQQRQEWRDDADELAKRAPMTPFVGLAIDCSAAIVALLADVDALQAEREALAAELARVRGEAADDRRAGATKLMQADAEIDGLRAQVARLEGFTESAQYSRDAELDLLDMLGDMD